MSLHAKMAEVIGTIGNVPKNGWNDFHKYKYVLESDVVDAVSSELAKRGVAFYASSKIIEMREWRTPPTQKNPEGKPTLITNVQVELTFADGESGETFTITSAGSGDDASDKGVYKATTGAVKYGLMKTFLIATGDDPEREAGRQDTSDRPVDNGFAQTSSQAITEARNELIRIVGAENAKTADALALHAAGVVPGQTPSVEQTRMIIQSLREAGGIPA